MKLKNHHQNPSYTVAGRPKPSKRGLTPLQGLAVVGLATVGLIGLLRMISAPAAGHTIPAKDFKVLTPKSAKSASRQTASSIESSYFQLPLPAGYTAQTASQTVPGLLYAQQLIKPAASGSLIISIGLKALPDGGLSQDPSYALRQQQAEHYRVTSETVGGDSVKIAADVQSAAITAFWPHDGYMATISISAGVSTPGDTSNRDELAVLAALLAAWRWR